MSAERVHGGPRAKELETLGIAREDLLDFSVNLNPYGPDPDVVAAIRAAKLDLYPDPTSFDTRAKMAPLIGVDSAHHIALGNGAADLLWATARAYLGPGRTALMVEPTFSEFRNAAAAAGADVVEWRAQAADGFTIDIAAIAAMVASRSPDALYICLPNNPTGTTLPTRDIIELAQKCSATKVVLDLSFASLGDHPQTGGPAVVMPENVVRVRSLTKDHALAGVRVGYVLGDADTIAAIDAQRPAWSASALAEAAAVAALCATDFVEASRKRLLADRAHMELALASLGYTVFPSAAPYLLIEVGDAPGLRRYLLTEHKVLVRDCSSFGLPTCVRLAARPSHQCERLMVGLCQWRRFH